MRKREVVVLADNKYCGWGRADEKPRRIKRNKWHLLLSAIHAEFTQANKPKFKRATHEQDPIK